jgi:hypothetical protein
MEFLLNVYYDKITIVNVHIMIYHITKTKNKKKFDGFNWRLKDFHT